MPIIFSILLLSLFSNLIFASTPSSFIKAKQLVYQIFSNHPKTLYCGCAYNSKHKVDLRSCHMDSAADTLGHQLSCWQTTICEHHGKHYKGRKCCEKLDYHFRQMESELYNLWPAVGLVNIARSNYLYAEVDSTDKFYGCDFKINKSSKEVEPANKVKGIVARATLFMSDKYHIPLVENKRQLYLSWNKAFRPSIWEKEWALKVAKIEGYSNPYILIE